MVELDKLEKVNAMASELKKHNFAKTNDEAARLAEEFHSGKKEPVEETESVKLEADELSIKRFELILEMQNKKIKEELESHENCIHQLNEKIENLNSEIEKLKGKALSSPIQFEKNEPEVQANLKKEVKEKRDHPRSGDYCSEDVDIQKMFYFGNK